MASSLPGTAPSSDVPSLRTCRAERPRDGVPDSTKADGRLAKTDDVLLDHIKNGFQSPGSFMAMPPKGGNPRLSDQDFRDVLAYLRHEFGKK